MFVFREGPPLPGAGAGTDQDHRPAVDGHRGRELGHALQEVPLPIHIVYTYHMYMYVHIYIYI